MHRTRGTRRRRRRRPSPPPATSSTLAAALLALLAFASLNSNSMFASAASVQGYVYWDRNGNGLLDGMGAANGELENGLIDVTVEVRPCLGDDEVLAAAQTLWPPSFPSGERIEGHSPVYPRGGYYRLELEGATSGQGRCLLSDMDLASAAQVARGCYLSITAPMDYEITSSFPVTGTNDLYYMLDDDADNDDGDGDASPATTDPFQWTPHNDNRRGDRSAGIANRGYRARTSCFGYHSPKRDWYVWGSDNDQSFRKVSLPNDARYGYATYLPERESYDRTLSILPLGMAQNAWPLPLRVVGAVALGMEFGSDDGAGKEVVAMGTSGEERFRFESTTVDEALSLRAYLADEALGQDIASYDSAAAADAPVQVQTNDTSANYRHTNSRGILTNTWVLDEVVESFLGEKLGSAAGAGGYGALEFIDVVPTGQWSMVRILDRMAARAPSNSTASGRRHLRLRGGGMHGSASSATASHLRGNARATQPQHPRTLVALPEPQLVFMLQIYGRYSEPNANGNPDKAARVTSEFGALLSTVMNRHRYELIAKMRQRSGYGQECYPVGGSGYASPSSGNPNAGGGTATGEGDYTEIEIGVVNRFDCDKLLPLYYFDLDLLAAREIDGGLGLSDDTDERQRLDRAMELFKEDDGYYGTFTAEAEESNVDASNSSGTPAWLLATTIVISVLAVACLGAGLYVRKERKKLQIERERRRKIREAKMLAREERKKKKQKKKGGKKDKDSEETEDDGSMGDDEREEKPQAAEKMSARTASLGYDSDDSELDRLFASMNGGKKDTVDKSNRADNDGVSDVERGESRPPQTRVSKKVRRIRTKGSSSETDHTSSHASGLNHSHASATERSTSLGESRNSSTLETTATPKSKGESPSASNDAAKDDGDNPYPPPHKIKLSKRDKMEKGISDLSTRLTSSLRRSVNHVVPELGDDVPGADAADSGHSRKKVRKKKGKPGVDAADSGRSHTKARKNKGKAEETEPGRQEHGDGEVDKAAMTAAGGSAPRRKRKPPLTKLVSSFRGSTDDKAPVAGNSDSEIKPKQKTVRMKKSAAPPRRGLSKAMVSMRMSVKNVLIGELSSSSEDEDYSPSSSSDSDSSSGDSSSSSDSSDTRPVRRRQQRKVSTGYKMKDTSQGRANSNPRGKHQDQKRQTRFDNKNEGKRKTLDSSARDGSKRLDSSGRDGSKRLNSSGRDGSERRLDSSRRDGSERRLGQKNAGLHESELTQTNEYLPHGLDRPNGMLKQKRSIDGSNRDGSNRSMGSRSKSNSDFNASHPSLPASSKSSRRGTVEGRRATRESNSESEGAKGSNGGAERRHKPKRRSGSEKPRERHHKKREKRRPARPSLAQLRSSLTSSVTSMKKGRSISNIAASALEEPPSPRQGADRATGRAPSERGSNHKGRRATSDRGSNAGGRATSDRGSNAGGRTASNRGLSSSHGALESTHRRTDGDGNGEKRTKKKTKSKPSLDREKRSSKDEQHSKHKSKRAGDGAAPKKSKRKAH